MKMNATVSVGEDGAVHAHLDADKPIEGVEAVARALGSFLYHALSAEHKNLDDMTYIIHKMIVPCIIDGYKSQTMEELDGDN